MALLDKLKGIIVSATNNLGTQTNAAETQDKKTPHHRDPFSDPVIKEYFQIICGMYNAFWKHRSSDDPKFFEDAQIKKYVEYVVGDAFDEEKFRIALAVYKSYRSDDRNRPYKKYDEDAVRLSIQTKEAGLYQLDIYTAYRLIYPEKIVAAAADLEKVLEIVKDSVSNEHFARGMAKMSYDNHIKQIVVADSFCAGHPITKALVLGCVFNSLIKKKNIDEYLTTHYDAVHLVLRALHFESQSGDRENYSALTDADYRNVLMQISAFKQEIEDHPFDKEEYIEKIATGIQSADIFGGVTKGLNLGEVLGYGDEFFIDSVDDYYADAVCNFVWHVIDNRQEWKVDGEVVNQSTDPDIMANIVLAYVERIAKSAGEG